MDYNSVYDKIEMDSPKREEFAKSIVVPGPRSVISGSQNRLATSGSRSPSIASESRQLVASVSRSHSLCSQNHNHGVVVAPGGSRTHSVCSQNHGHGAVSSGSRSPSVGSAHHPHQPCGHQGLASDDSRRQSNEGERKKKKKKKRSKSTLELEEQQIIDSVARERRRMALVISIFAAGIFIIAVLLIAISLRMAPSIDAKVRKENEQLINSLGREEDNLFNATGTTASREASTRATTAD